MDILALPENTTAAVNVLVASEYEPTAVVGDFTATDTGFILSYALGDERYTTFYSEDCTTISAAGKTLNYTIVLPKNGERTKTTLETIFGNIDYFVKPIEQKLTIEKNSLRLLLGFMLSTQNEDEITRNVDITITLA